jgi:hypothetical protein
MKMQYSWTIAVVFALLTAVAIAGSIVSVAWAQSATSGTAESKIKDTLQAAANQNKGMARIGGMIIIVGACPDPTDASKCTWYNTTPIQASPGG